MMMKATKEQAVAATYVFWDIKRCPIPPGCEPRRVGQCIKRALKNAGYSGRLTISAVGLLSEIPDDVLRKLFSTGILINHIAWDDIGFSDFLLGWSYDYEPPVNLMVISDQEHYRAHLPFFMGLGYNVVNPFNSYEPASPDALWETFLAQEGEWAFDEHKFSGPGKPARELWACQICDGFRGQGFENFLKHLYTQKHRSNVLSLIPNNKPLRHPDFTKTNYKPQHRFMVWVTNPMLTEQPKASFNKEKTKKMHDGPVMVWVPKQPKNKCMHKEKTKKMHHGVVFSKAFHMVNALFYF